MRFVFVPSVNSLWTLLECSLLVIVTRLMWFQFWSGPRWVT